MPAHAATAPRRASDADGREITPLTQQNAMDRGVTALRAICACGHKAEVSIHVVRWASTSFVPDAGMTLRCDACGTSDPKPGRSGRDRVTGPDAATPCSATPDS